METTDYKLYSYKMKHDNRFAPNPLFGILTLATCKPAMRRNTKIGNWIAGWTSKQLKDSPTEVGKEKLVYLAKVTQKLSFAEYWEKYEQKRPVKTEDTKVIQRYGDNIYKPNPTNPKEFIQIENNFHGKDSRSHRCAKQCRECGAHAAHDHNVFVFFIKAEQFSKTVSDTSTEL